MNSWKTCAPAKLDLAQALADMAPDSVINFEPIGLELKIRDSSGRVYSRSARNYDLIYRLAMWVLVVLLVFAMDWGNKHPILPEFGTIALMAFIFGGLGYLCFRSLISAFHSRLTETLKKAKSATPKEEIILEIVSLYWALRHTRPPLSVIVNPFVWWSNADNNLDILTLLPLQKAMVWISENRSLSWYDRSDIRKHLSDVEESLDVVNDVWFRWVWLAAFIHLGAFIGGGVFTVWSLLVPILVRF